MQAAYLLCDDLSPLLLHREQCSRQAVSLRRSEGKAVSPLQSFFATRKICEAPTLAVLLLRPQKVLIQRDEGAQVLLSGAMSLPQS